MKSQRNIANKIRSFYVLRDIFKNISIKKKLQITKYNNNIKDKLDIDINDYKKYSQIEIEIKTNHSFGQFINYQQNINDKYFHIYFNDDKEEVKRNYFCDDEKVKTIKIIIDYQIESFMELFKYPILIGGNIIS